MTDVLDDTAPVRRRYGQPDEELQAVYDAQPLKVKCGLCVWEYEGPAGEARVAQHEHQLAHAAAKPADRKPAAARSQGLTAADRRAVHLKDDREETPVSACKIDGCTETGLDKRGPYAGLCFAHKREKAAAMGAARRTVKPPPGRQTRRRRGLCRA